MKKKRVKQIPRYLYYDDPWANFSMVTDNLLRAKQFQELSAAAKNFYVICCTHKKTAQQSQCLYMALKEYYQTIGEEKPDIEISYEAGTCKKSYRESDKFVIPQSHLAEYGISPQYASKLKKELIAKGFIRIFANGKHKHNAYDKRVTIYEFINDWKKST